MPAVSETKKPRKKPISSQVTTSSKRLVLSDDKSMHDNDTKERCNLPPPLAFEHFTRKRDINFYNCFSTIALFKTVFNHVAVKAHVMTYWEGQQSHIATLDKPKSYQKRIKVILSSPLYGPNDLPPINRKGPKKKLSLEQEFLLIMMRLRLGFTAGRFSMEIPSN